MESHNSDPLLFVSDFGKEAEKCLEVMSNNILKAV